VAWREEPVRKDLVYEEAWAELQALLADLEDPVTRMSTVCAVLKARIPWASWVGFYRVVRPGMLEVGPYQGGLGCLQIPFDRGVCGAAARTGETQVVPDVHAFPGHVACDSSARSEIVVPVRDRHGQIVAVLDLDSHLPGAFDDLDRVHLERVAGAVAPMVRA
jgi:GAF domain-containing protein